MFNRRTLLVASADIVRGESEQVDRLKELIEARDVNRLMGFLNSDQVEVEGKGAILVAMIAALSRRATHARVLGVKEPENDEPGSVGAVLWRAI
ncbi:MAG: hypothetical protein ACOCTG_01135, partial [Bacteroidota bacterium]